MTGVVQSSAAEVEQSEGGPGGVSLLEIAAELVRRGRLILVWSVGVGAIAAALTFLEPRTYTATATFIPNASDDSRSLLGGAAAAQLGILINAASSATSDSPRFYGDLMRSRALLGPIADDTLTVVELEGRRVSVPDVIGVTGSHWPRVRERVITRLATRVILAKAMRETGVVTIAVQTRYASASHAIAQLVLRGVNDFNLRTRQSQAGAERRFIEVRLAQARDSLRHAEDAMEAFLRSNRDYRNSAQLALSYDRLQRAMMLQQGIVQNLALSYENTRIREIRDLPVITIIDAPKIPANADSLRRVLQLVLGLFAGVFIAVGYVFASFALTRRRASGDPHAEFFAHWIAGVERQFSRVFRRVKGRPEV